MQEYRSVVQGRRALSPGLEHDDPARPRYAYTQIDKSIIHKAIVSIYNRAGAETRALYDRGREVGGEEENNWIIRWMLYHCFRYRDGRNKRPVVSATQEVRSWTMKEHSGANASVEQLDSASHYSEPIRRPQEDRRNLESGHKMVSSKSVGRPLPYDPVRA